MSTNDRPSPHSHPSSDYPQPCSLYRHGARTVMDLVKVFEAHGVLRTIQEAHDTKLIPIDHDGPSPPPGLDRYSEDDIDDLSIIDTDDLSIMDMAGVSTRADALARQKVASVKKAPLRSSLTATSLFCSLPFASAPPIHTRSRRT